MKKSTKAKSKEITKKELEEFLDKVDPMFVIDNLDPNIIIDWLEWMTGNDLSYLREQL